MERTVRPSLQPPGSRSVTLVALTGPFDMAFARLPCLDENSEQKCGSSAAKAHATKAKTSDLLECRHGPNESLSIHGATY